MTIGPAGNLALLWQEMSQAGSDAHYRVLDPASTTRRRTRNSSMTRRWNGRLRRCGMPWAT